MTDEIEIVDVDEDQLEAELVYNEKVVTHPKLGAVKLSRPTPRQERLISEEKRKQFHKDYKDETVLSRTQVLKIAKERGDWSEIEDQRLKELYLRNGELVGNLYLVEYKGVDDCFIKLHNAREKLRTIFVGKEDVLEAIDRFANMQLDRAASDKVLIMKSAPSTEVDEVLADIEYLRELITELKELAEVREELLSLVNKQSTIFGDTAEQRASTTEEMARMYYCARRDDGSPLWESFDSMWDENTEHVKWLQNEMFFFLNGVPDRIREIMSDQGFSQPEIDMSTSSDDSPDLPLSKPDGELQQSEEMSSSEDMELVTQS